MDDFYDSCRMTPDEAADLAAVIARHPAEWPKLLHDYLNEAFGCFGPDSTWDKPKLEQEDDI